jgi:2-polyprenyl-3-methyl-5-hydroxy-6-metoxy-1,4-benzoquinol methylase
MEDHAPAFEANRLAWNERAKLHVGSKFYDVDGFVGGNNSLTAVELELLGDIRDTEVLHLQCHFGLDTLSLVRLGARTTGLDISDEAIRQAVILSERAGLHAEWVVSNVLDHRPELDGRFDTVFTSFGTIGWLPEVKTWAANIERYLKPGGRLVFVEFHPMVWMFDNDFERITYSYFNREPIVEEEVGSYADRNSNSKLISHTWNHSLQDVLSAILHAGLRIARFVELDGAPHNAFQRTVMGSDGLFRIEGMEGKLPMVYGLTAVKGS